MTSPLTELGTPQRKAIELAREVAQDKGVRPFLVGGPVRDLLLGRHVIDIDLTLEDGSSTFARSLAKRIEGRVRSFPQFLTYKVTAEGLPEIDIATARKERYRKPGALPSVTAGRLADDLVRRDFSINAMAMDLGEGRLVDPTGGEADLRSRTLRVLHDRSFIDDPTRIFRALRLAARLQFTLEPRTADLLHGAIREGALETVARERIWRELFLAMDEADAPEIVTTLRETGALDLLLGRASEPRALRQRLEEVEKQIESDASVDRYVVYTGAMLIGADATAELFEGAGFSQKRTKNILQIAHELPRLTREIAQASSDAQRFRIYKSVPPEMLAILAASRESEAPSVARYRDYRSFKLPLRGNDLEVPAGPHVARALERTREAVYLGEIAPQEARSFASGLALQYLNREEQPEKS
jgi:tRNA nucleotidyltransferase (CCA-adding enzyme)